MLHFVSDVARRAQLAVAALAFVAILPLGAAPARVLRDIEYARPGGRPLLLDLYLPARAAGKLPVIVSIHGGGWHSGSKEASPGLDFWSRGYAVASINYRLMQEAKFPAQLEDCETAVRWVRAHAGEYNFDPGRIGVWGASAGGHLAALLGTRGKGDSRVEAVVDFFGPIDVAEWYRSKGLKEVTLFGIPLAGNEARLREANPTAFIGADTPPFLIGQGGSDTLVLPAQSRLLYAALHKAGVEATLKIVEGVAHSVNGLDMDDDVQFFLDRHLKPGAVAVNPDLLRAEWPARWAEPKGAGCEFGVYHFRRAFDLNRKPSSFIVHVTADNRYELFVNGARASEGPARGDLQHWRFETIDLAPYLRAGRNVLAAVVWNWSGHAPGAQFTSRTAFLMQGNTDTESAANTPDGWRCVRDRAYGPMPRKTGWPIGVLAGAGEIVSGEGYLWGWEQPGYDDSHWETAAALQHGLPYGRRNDDGHWMLVRDELPPMENRAGRLVHVVRSTGVKAGDDFARGSAPIVIPPHTTASILLDQTRLTTAYPELTVSGGRGARVEMTYSEALWIPQPGAPPHRWLKGNRNETEGKEILGLSDRFLPDGGPHRTYRPLWWRAFRFLQIDVATGEESVTLDNLITCFTAYPFRERASVEAPDPELAKIWEVGWRTARLCAHETYMDCPYYEQMQYVGDTRVQALISLAVAGDDRLMRNAIAQFDDSRISDGITYSRYPSNVPQFIPTFSLLWVDMLHDFWMYRDDPAFVRRHLPGIRTVLGWFERHEDEDGLSGRIPWWPFVDWARSWESGVPGGAAPGRSSIVSLQWAMALQDAADLEQSAGDPDFATRDRQQASRILGAVRRTCWDGRRGLFADTPARNSFSQHANILAVLAGAITGGDARAVMEKVLSDPTLTQATYYFRFYLDRAANQAGLGDRYLTLLDPWREMLHLGLTTWAETPEPTRSDCHAWSASPNYELLATVAGIEPAEPGFRSVRIHPHLGSLPWLRARMPHPAGMIEVDWTKLGGALRGTVTLPAGLSGRFEDGTRLIPLHPGRNVIPEAAVN